MGLDGYLEGVCFMVENDGAQILSGDRSLSLAARRELGYWRKNWPLHNQIVNNYWDGDDDAMSEIPLSLANIDEILAALIDEQDEIDAAREARNECVGKEQIEAEEIADFAALNTIRIFAKARIWLLANIPKTIRRVVYKSSW